MGNKIIVRAELPEDARAEGGDGILSVEIEAASLEEFRALIKKAGGRIQNEGEDKPE